MLQGVLRIFAQLEDYQESLSFEPFGPLKGGEFTSERVMN